MRGFVARKPKAKIVDEKNISPLNFLRGEILVN
jgi:hypothetical protein